MGNFIKQPVLKNSENILCMNLLLPNKSFDFQTNFVIKTRLSDFHKIEQFPEYTFFYKNTLN